MGTCASLQELSGREAGRSLRRRWPLCTANNSECPEPDLSIQTGRIYLYRPATGQAYGRPSARIHALHSEPRGATGCQGIRHVLPASQECCRSTAETDSLTVL